MKPSFERKIGRPSRINIGPPPTASTSPDQSGVSVRRTVTFDPRGASVASRPAPVAPRPTSTAPPGGIGVAPPCFACTTVPTRSRSGAAGGNGVRTTSTVSVAAGVAGPYADVYSAVPPATGSLFSTSGRRWPAPCHVPANFTRSTTSVPSDEIPVLERSGFGGDASTPFISSIPLG